MEKSLITPSKVVQVAQDKNYWCVDGTCQDYDCFVFGVRNSNIDQTEDQFDDFICIMYSLGGYLRFQVFKGTTDPGKPHLTNPIFPAAQAEGTAIMVEGQYRGAYRLGKHGSGNWRHDALQQVMPIKIYRDSNKDEVLDMSDYQKTSTGMYGINIHASSLWGELDKVGRYSAGCQVFAIGAEYREFINLCKAQSIKGLGDRFTYTLFNEEDFIS